jgi:hypothetical protein
MRSRVFIPISACLIFFTHTGAAAASTNGEIVPSTIWTIPGTVPTDGESAGSRQERLWQVDFLAPQLNVTTVDNPPAANDQPRAQAFQYSEAYGTRRKIHMIASYATIPLFVGQYIAGQKLYNGDGGDTAKSVHGVLAGSVAALFGINTVTGVWNMWEARGDPNGKTRRLVHGMLMLGADAGFVATGLMAPGGHEGGGDGGGGGGSSQSAHRTVAITSMGVAAASYVYMLVTR